MKRRSPAVLTWLGGLLALYLVAPLLAGAQQAAQANWRAADAAALWRACLISFATASAATLVIAIGGIPLGYVLARTRGPAAAALGFLVQIPLALPPLASGVLLLFLVGYDSPIGRLTNGALTDSLAGIVIAEIFVAAPFLVIAARAAFLSMDGVLEGVAATLGRSAWETFFRVSLPLAWPTIFSGLALAWLRAFGEFGATLMVAYHPYSLPVYTYVAFGSSGLPAMLPVLAPTVVLALAAMAVSDFAHRRFVAGGRTRRAKQARESLAEPPAPVASRPASAAREVSISLKKTLGDFRLDLAWSTRARRLAILGPSGSGKSLILRLLAGLETAEAAHVAIDGAILSNLDPAARGVAYVPQNYGLFPHMSLLEQLLFPVGADLGSARRWIARLGLEGLENRLPSALSLGQQQRTALARAFGRPASLVLLDEPFSALDAPLRARLREQFAGLQSEIEAPTILVTHDPHEAALLADELLVLVEGAAVQSGPTREVFMRPANGTVARLLGAQEIAEGAVLDDRRLDVGGGVLIEYAGPSLLPGARVGWCVSPAAIRIVRDGRYPGLAHSLFSAGVEDRVKIQIGEARMTARVEGHVVSVGQACRVEIEPSAVQIWPLEPVSR